MYLGTKTFPERRYRDRYAPGIGALPKLSEIVEVIRHYYQCEQCGKELGFIEAADEPFYCLGCQHLVGVLPPTP